jgi:predicted ATP-dependent endonuclease of OLD family
VAHLDSSTRLNLALSCASFNPNTSPPQKLLQSLYLDKDIEGLLQQAFLESFEYEIKLDYSELQNFCLRIAKKLPEIPKDPQDAYIITKNLSKIDEQGDGYRSFVGIVLGLLLSKDRIILLDEPEAFLHPAQARYLGKWIVDNSDKFDGQLIVSTHNSNLLAGILSKGKAVDIYRLNRRENITTYNIISADTNSKLSKSPILSSQRVLESIFHKGVIICEADADRA